MKNLPVIAKHAARPPIHADGAFMLCDENGSYLAQIDATEDSHHAAVYTQMLLAHWYNIGPMLLNVLKNAAQTDEIRKAIRAAEFVKPRVTVD